MIAIPDILSVVLQAAAFVLLLQAAGAVFFAAAFGPALTLALASVRSLARNTAFAALFVVAAHYVLEAARIAGDLSGVLDSSLQKIAWISSAGSAFSVQVLGLLLIIAGMRSPVVRLLTPDRLFTSAAGLSPGAWLRRLSTRGFTLVGVAGAVLVAGSFALTGHTVTSSRRVVLAPLLLTHLLIVAFWLGALLPLCLVTMREPRERASRVIGLFSAAAVWLVPVILLVGVAIAALLLPDFAALERPYGQMVIAKTALFAFLMLLAALNKWRLGPALDGENLSAGHTFRRVVIAEYVILVGVLSVTAVMVTLFSPE